MKDRKLLKFSAANAKIEKLAPVLGVKKSEIYGFSLPAGYTCPAADRCLSRADRDTGKITDGERCEFRCFAASLECRLQNTRDAHWYNLDLLRAAGIEDPHAMADLLLASLPANAKVVRIHVSGDFFSPNYLRAWIMVARSKPGVIFYGYTKSIHFVIPFEKQLPPNMRIVYSDGGKYDDIARQAGWPTAYVVMSPEEAAMRDLPIDHKDSLCVSASHDFALLIHGTQRRGSAAAKAARRNSMLKRN